ncbi:thiosulfate sulfurtransferase chloroplastic-like [Chlorella sorokiniana]|uniref:Thiosulfate sulfurtransferase chloroplastic-like n=1 Tax=Chlorella sorokiniana TaxID=3076 RepID=A0A2P6THF9_CHLSO|nr:thiosulfate sulfurtransferase chloroplastic-like [Chlorella sorokiniana]|eukprot:PRW33722.1 thiosulfate sulfurtransferase chloroplastic-like [Chlorella sorokiniana]
MADAQRYESVDVEAADGLIQSKGYTLLDVRTPEEFQVGHAPGALNIPFMVQGPNGRTHNQQFMDQVRSAFPDPSEAKLCVACGGGTRGTSAATAIAEAGYSSITCMPGGMKAWAASGLPTTAEESGKL